ncbi:MAG: ATP synthase F1 subunit delta [Planctomycetes bacterium]|nr:ATP synthase F1 subunit delta [Planctomycetota bacterium]
MLDNSVAVTFVNALLEIAVKKGLLEQIEKDLDLVCDVITQNADFKKVLLHPSVTRNDKKNLIKKVFGAPVSGLMRNFLSLVVDRRKEWVLESIPDVYKKTIDEKKGVLRAKVQTVIPIEGDRLNNLRKRLDKITGKSVEVEVVNDPQILGGMVIRIGNTMIDRSVASRLKNLKARLLELRMA